MKTYQKLYKFAFFLNLTAVLSFQSAQAQQWVLTGSVPTPGSQPSISIVDANAAYVAGGALNDPKVFRTTNGGANWTLLPVTGISRQLGCVWAVNSTTAYVGEGTGSGNAILFKTTNAGTTWTSVVQTGSNEGYFVGMYFSRINPQVGGADAEKLYITTNGGANWTLVNAGVSGVSAAQNSFVLIDQNFFGFGLNNGAARVRTTTDGGTVWGTQAVNLSGSYTSGFTYKDDKLTGLSSTSASMPNISRTTDGGITWTAMSIGAGLTGNTFLTWIPGTNVVYIVGSNGAVKRSADSGLNWVSMTTPAVSGINHVDFIRLSNVIYGIAVSSDGSVMKVTDSLLLTGIGTTGSEIPSEFSLSKNYPNPFNPSTVISFGLPKASFTSLSVYDALGREVQVLVNENLNAGKYEYSWDAASFSSGIYYYKLTAESFSETRKMILMK